MSRAFSLYLALLLALPLAAQDAEQSIDETDAEAFAAEAEESLEPYLDRTPENCVQTSRIRRTRIIDDETIVFFMRGRETYQNILPLQCAGLKRADRFAYEAQGGRLCSSDTIQVLEDFGPGRLIPTFVCRLGEYYPISDLEAQELIAISNQRPPSRRERRRQAEQAQLEVEAVELPPEQRVEPETSEPGRDED